MPEMQQMLDNYIFDNGLRYEGRRGTIALCKVAGVLGYKDPQMFGRVTPEDSIGQLINMLEDNPGMVQAMVEWIGQQRMPEWIEAMKAASGAAEDDDDEHEFDNLEVL